MTLHRKEYQITLSDRINKQTVKGLVSDTFGMHKGPVNWVVTHLRTGGMVTSFPKQNQARDFIHRAENAAWLVSWDTNDISKLKGNKYKALDIKELSMLL